MNNILQNTIVIGAIISVLFSVLGNVILWKRYSYFSDGLAHSCLLGVLIHYIFEIDLLYAVYISSVCFALLVKGFSNYYNKNLITLIVAQGFLALSIILSSNFKDAVNITDFFLGDLLLVSQRDIMILASLAVITLVWFIVFYRSIMVICISPDIARSYNIKTNWIELSYLLMLATVIAITIKILGSLLVSSLLIIPAAVASIFSRSPIKMLINSFIISLATYYSGLYLSFNQDLPTAPIIVFLSFVVFISVRLIKSRLSLL
ncbi:MAG: Zinc/manganese transporter permease protein [Rickettsiaceae bacterium]|jgi:zinc transport system permease protein|nr:Zinc/manganese transporter permease protein [Rickettsiaceae bacterium]